MSVKPALQLRWVVIADAGLAVLAGMFTITMSLTVARNGWLTAIGAVVVGSGIVIATALVPLRNDRVMAALWILSVANWAVAIIAAAMATFAWPLLMVSALLPSVVAASYAPSDRLWRFVVPSLLASLVVTGVGTLQDFTGITERSPEWLRTAILLTTAPGFGAVLVLVSMQHHRNLTRALGEERAVRLELADQAEELRRSRQRVVAATDRARRRIEQDLHDGAQSRLVGINLQLAAAKGQLGSDPEHVRGVLDDISREVHQAHAELRDLAHGLYPTVLTQHGLVAAIEAAADRTPAPVKLDLQRVGRLRPDVEATVYFCILEALQNASRHAGASRVDIVLDRNDASVHFAVVDDGVGFDTSIAGGHGLVNLADRLGALGGAIEITSIPGRTFVGGVVPLHESDPHDV